MASDGSVYQTGDIFTQKGTFFFLLTLMFFQICMTFFLPEIFRRMSWHEIHVMSLTSNLARRVLIYFSVCEMRFKPFNCQSVPPTKALEEW